MDIELVTEPVESEVLNLLSVSDLKLNERISHSVHDALLTDCIKKAYAKLDGRYGWLNRSILTQTWKLWLPTFRNVVELPFGPVQSVSAIEYYDTDETLQTLASSYYEVQTGEFVGKITKEFSSTWPSVDERQRAVSIEYVAGFGTAATMEWRLKYAIKDALTLLASHIYRNPAATYAEPRNIAVNRTIEFGLEQVVGFLRVPPDHG